MLEKTSYGALLIIFLLPANLYCICLGISFLFAPVDAVQLRGIIPTDQEISDPFYVTSYLIIGPLLLGQTVT